MTITTLILEELHMENKVPARLMKVAEKKAKVRRTEYKIIRRPRWKEYTLIKYKDKKEISREKIWIDESKYFPSDEDFFWEPKNENVELRAA